jgi:hypothetical protein
MKIMRPKINVFITLLMASFLLWSLIGWLRLFETITIWNLLTRTLTHLEPEYLIFSAISWGIAGLVVAFGMLFRCHWARFAPQAALGFVLWFWIERVVLTRAVTSWTNCIFSAGLSLLWLVYTFWVAYSAEKSGYFFRRRAP